MHTIFIYQYSGNTNSNEKENKQSTKQYEHNRMMPELCPMLSIKQSLHANEIKIFLNNKNLFNLESAISSS
jgi:hypothetical protein